MSNSKNKKNVQLCSLMKVWKILLPEFILLFKKIKRTHYIQQFFQIFYKNSTKKIDKKVVTLSEITDRQRHLISIEEFLNYFRSMINFVTTTKKLQVHEAITGSLKRVCIEILKSDNL